MTSKRLQTPLRRTVKRKGSWLIAILVLGSGLAMATLSVGFGLWMILELIDANRVGVANSQPKKREVRTVQSSGAKPEPQRFTKTASVDTLRFSIGQGLE